MTAYSVLEVCIVTVVVLFCTHRAFSRLMPKLHASLRQRLATNLARPGRPGWMRKLGKRWAAPATAAGCGTDSGCGTCGSCGPTQPGAGDTDARPVKLVRR